MKSDHANSDINCGLSPNITTNIPEKFQQQLKLMLAPLAFKRGQKLVFLSRVLLIAMLLLLVNKTEAASYDVTGIVNFFCDHAGRDLASLAYRDKEIGVPIFENMHRSPNGFINYLDNEIIKVAYQSSSESEAKQQGSKRVSP